MKLADFVRDDLVWVIEGSLERDELLRIIAQRIAQVEPAVNSEQLYQSLLARETTRSTATPEGVALPHAMVDGVNEHFVAAALVPGGVDFKSPEGGRSDLVFVLVGPSDKPWEHLRVLARVARICHGAETLSHLRQARTGMELHALLIDEDRRHA